MSDFRAASKELFVQQYSKEIHSAGTSLECVMEFVENELKRRREFSDNVSIRRRVITERYKPLHKFLYEFSEDFISSAFLNEFSTHYFRKECLEQYAIGLPDFQLYQFPVFTEKFCDKLLEELNHFSSHNDLPNPRPNTMNNYGILLDEMGLEGFFDKLRENYLNKIAAAAFPEWVDFDCTGCLLDSHRAFTVSYSPDTDVDLALHYDNAEVTLNVALTDQSEYDGGELYFLGMVDEPMESMLGSTPLKHKKGWAFLHRGRQYHGALPVEDGKRENLIIWMRNSNLRKECCPMCWQLPQLLPVDSGYGDGFILEKPIDNIKLCTLI